MGLKRQEVEDRMAQRSKKDLAFLHGLKSAGEDTADGVVNDDKQLKDERPTSN